jgi:hypothetical protein
MTIKLDTFTLSTPTTIPARRSRLRSRCGPAVALVLALGTPLAASAYRVKMPYRGDALPASTFIQTRGHGGTCDATIPAVDRTGVCALDVTGARWDTTLDEWTNSKTVGQESATSDADNVIFGTPIIAPVDGIVLGCARQIPDDVPGAEACSGPNGQDCTVSGNHLNILTSDGKLLLLAHLKYESIPASLCPIPGEVYTENDATCSNGWTRLPNGSRVDLFYTNQGQTPVFPQIKKGDVIGAIGDSGNSGGPHLHMHVNPFQYVGTDPCAKGYETLEFEESWYMQRPNSAAGESWTPLQGQMIPVNGTTPYLMFADPVGPRVDELALEDGDLPAVVLTSATGSGGVAAYRNDDGNFSAVGFTTDGNGDFVLGTGHEKGAVSDIALAKISRSTGSVGRHVVAAVRNGSGNLQLIPYYVESDGDLIQGTNEALGAIGFVEATHTPLDTPGFAVAFKTASDNLAVYHYDAVVSGTNISVSQTDTASVSSTSKVADIDVDTIVAGRANSEVSGAFKGVVTAERRNDDTLWVRTWSISAAGVVAADSVAQAMDPGNDPLLVSDVDIAVVGDGTREFAVVSARLKPSNVLAVQTWQIASTGALTRLEHATSGVGTIGSALASGRVGTQDALTAVRTGSGDLSMLSWSVSPKTTGANGGVLRRVGTRDAGPITAISVSGRSLNDLVVTYRSSTGALGLLRYLINFSASL